MYFVVRCLGDFLHVVSILLLLHIVRNQQQQGKSVSLRSQELFLVAFLARFVAAIVYFTLYDLVLQSFVVVATGFAVYSLQQRIVITHQQQPQQGETPCYYEAARDNFPHVWYLLVPCSLLSWFVVWYFHSLNSLNNIIITEDDAFKDDESYPPDTNFLWTFSFVQEAVAIFPQLCLLGNPNHPPEMAPTFAHMMVTLALYKILYIVYWVLESRYTYYNVLNDDGYQMHQVLPTPTVPCITGVMQTCLFADFFYCYMSMLYQYLYLATSNRSGIRAFVGGPGGRQDSENDDEIQQQQQEKQQQQQQQTIKYNPVCFRMLSTCFGTRRLDSQNATGPAATSATTTISEDNVVAPAPMFIFGNRDGCCCGNTKPLVGFSLGVVSMFAADYYHSIFFDFVGVVFCFIAGWLWLRKTLQLLLRQQRQRSPELFEAAFDITIQDVARMVVPPSHFMEDCEMIELMETKTTTTTTTTTVTSKTTINSYAGIFSSTNNSMQPLIKQDPLLQLQLPTISSFSGEDNQASISYRANTSQTGRTKQCFMTFQFAECQGGWTIEQAGSSGSLSWILPSNIRNAGSADTDENTGEDNNKAKNDDAIDSAIVHTKGQHNDESSCSQFVITKGFVSSSTGKAYWVEKDCDDNRQLRRVIIGQFDPVSHSFSGEWQSSDGNQGHRTLDCTTNEVFTLSSGH